MTKHNESTCCGLAPCEVARSRRAQAATIMFALAVLLLPAGAGAQYSVLHNFTGLAGDGANPTCAMIFDSAHNLYGTTKFGGTYNQGVVFELVYPGYAYQPLYSFTGGGDGAQPYDGLIEDSSGNLYGTTSAGGSGHGTVFELPGPSHTALKLLHTFTGGTDGGTPYAGLILDKSNNLYGTTYKGGIAGLGVVFRLAAPGHTALTVLHSFIGGIKDGSNPFRGVIHDSSTNLYGTTEFGGSANAGIVYELIAPAYTTKKLLYSFTGGGDGKNPIAYPIRDSKGNLYGTTEFGGAYGNGVTYELVYNSVTKTFSYSKLHDFPGSPYGANPLGFLYRNSVTGDLYGTAYAGGSGEGVLFDSLNVLHTFGGSDGAQPYSGLIPDSLGNLYGTTEFGGSGGQGVVFMTTP